LQQNHWQENHSQENQKDKIMIKSLFRISVSLGVIGIVLGIVMGIRQDFALMPAHAHLNLLGFVTMFLSALYYRVVPEAAASRLARYQAIVSVAGAVVFPIGIACVLLGGHERFEPVVVAGALTVLLGMALFAVIVFRTSGQERVMPAGAEQRQAVFRFENKA
jgi:uncharacterized membrane protein